MAGEIKQALRRKGTPLAAFCFFAPDFERKYKHILKKVTLKFGLFCSICLYLYHQKRDVFISLLFVVGIS